MSSGGCWPTSSARCAQRSGRAGKLESGRPHHIIGEIADRNPRRRREKMQIGLAYEKAGMESRSHHHPNDQFNLVLKGTLRCKIGNQSEMPTSYRRAPCGARPMGAGRLASGVFACARISLIEYLRTTGAAGPNCGLGLREPAIRRPPSSRNHAAITGYGSAGDDRGSW
jgi:hypothetical protein